MPISKRPHSAVISWKAAGARDATTGVYTEGAESTVTISCNIQPNKSGQYIVAASGDSILYSWHVFCDIFDEADNIPEEAKITFIICPFAALIDKVQKILLLSKYQKHVEIWV